MKDGIGASSGLYKICRICGESKYYTRFSPKGRKGRLKGKRKPYCKQCVNNNKQLRKEKVAGLVGDENHQIVMLGKMGAAKWETLIDLDKAKTLVIEGVAEIINHHTIRKMFNRQSLRLMILKRDQYTCFFCGKYGDTVDHVVPKSKGGLSTFSNCVCACKECNFKKADHLHFPKGEIQEGSNET